MQQNFYANLDRLRRTRNNLVHQAKTDVNIKLLSDFMAKVARHYLQELFHNSTLLEHTTIDDIIYK